METGLSPVEGRLTIINNVIPPPPPPAGWFDSWLDFWEHVHEIAPFVPTDPIGIKLFLWFWFFGALLTFAILNRPQRRKNEQRCCCLCQCRDKSQVA